MAITGLVIAFVWGSIWLRFRTFEPEPPPEPVDLRPWDYLGCLQLEIDPWVGPAAVEAPRVIRHLMLLPDSVDEWGRLQPSYRAVPLTPGVAEEGVAVRWFTRADTFWVVWSDAAARGGAALREGRNRLEGRAVAELHDDSVTLEAGAAAWDVNCHSLRPDRIGPVER